MDNNLSASDKLKTKRQEPASKLNKRLRKDIRITPWKDIWELESVGRGLLTVLNEGFDDSSRILNALDTVTIWKARSHALEALPHAVESTAALAQVYWRDQKDRRNVSITELRLAYSAAIVRCINGLADALQQQRFVAAPVSMLCGQLGIPSWLVDIRHEASHNALPTLPVLKLATVTLLEYLQSEYWIPTCPQWSLEKEFQSKGDNVKEAEIAKQTTTRERAIHILVEYKKCVSKSQTDTTTSDDKSTEDSRSDKNKVSVPSKKKATTSPRPFDTFFGDSDNDTSAEDDEEDPLLGNFWGSSIGTNSNRFALLEPPKKVKAPPKKKPKQPQKTPPKKKLPGEKYPMEYAKSFVTAVSPQEGYSIAIQFLVWGGIGGTPQGRGVLIPGSVVAFPATVEGIQKSRQRYLPLVEVIGKAWPGFCSALLIHLVDFILSIEATCAEQGSVDPGSVRKLFFLSSWIRVMVSEVFVSKLYPDGKGTTTTVKGKKGKHSADVALASYESIQPLRYPLNSLCDRLTTDGYHQTSQDMLQTFTEILGPNRVVGCGILLRPDPIVKGSLIPPSCVVEQEQGKETMVEHGPALPDGKMSLDEMEALLSSEDESEPKVLLPSSKNEASTAQVTTTELPVVESPDRPIPWSRCTAWDECTIGSMPGRPV